MCTCGAEHGSALTLTGHTCTILTHISRLAGCHLFSSSMFADRESLGFVRTGFLQAECPSRYWTKCVEALKGSQITDDIPGKSSTVFILTWSTERMGCWYLFQYLWTGCFSYISNVSNYPYLLQNLCVIVLETLRISCTFLFVKGDHIYSYDAGECERD